MVCGALGTCEPEENDKVRTADEGNRSRSVRLAAHLRKNDLHSIVESMLSCDTSGNTDLELWLLEYQLRFS